MDYDVIDRLPDPKDLVELQTVLRFLEGAFTYARLEGNDEAAMRVVAKGLEGARGPPRPPVRLRAGAPGGP